MRSARSLKEEYEIAMRKKAHHQELVDEQVASAAAARTQRPRMHDSSRSPRSMPSDRDSTTPDPNRQGPPGANQELSMLSKGKGRGSVSTKMEVDDDASARQRDLTSGGADDDDEGSDREEEVVALIDNDSEGLPQQEDEPRSLSPCDDAIDHEPTPQLAEKTGDVDMASDPPEVNA